MSCPPWIDWVPYVDVSGNLRQKGSLITIINSDTLGSCHRDDYDDEEREAHDVNREVWELGWPLWSTNHHSVINASHFFSGALSGWIFMQITFVADALQQQCLYDLHHLAARLRCYAWSLIAFDWFLIQSAPPISQLRYTPCSPLTTSLVQIYFNFFPNIVGTPLLIVLIAAGLCFRKDELWIQARGNCNAEWKEIFQVLLAIFEKRSFKIENRFSTEWPYKCRGPWGFLWSLGLYFVRVPIGPSQM